MKYSQEEILQSNDIETFIEKLNSSGCNLCSLSEHENRVVVGRGNPKARIMLVGEGPGLEEDVQGIAFVGPAGRLLDKIMASISLDTNRDMRLSNCVRCRPVSGPGTGKQNYTPLAEQKKACMPYLLREIELVNPDIIVTIGRTAAVSLYDLHYKTSMGSIAGQWMKPPRECLYLVRCLALYHSAALLHSKRDPTKYKELKAKMKEHVQTLRTELDKMRLS